MNSEALNLSILGPAFLAGLLVLATHVPLGQQVLKRRGHHPRGHREVEHVHLEQRQRRDSDRRGTTPDTVRRTFTVFSLALEESTRRSWVAISSGCDCTAANRFTNWSMRQSICTDTLASP